MKKEYSNDVSRSNISTSLGKSYVYKSNSQNKNTKINIKISRESIFNNFAISRKTYLNNYLNYIKEKEKPKSIKMIRIYSRNNQQSTHFLSSFEMIDEKMRSLSKKHFERNNQESKSTDIIVSKKILPLRLKNNETDDKDIYHKPIIKVKSFNIIPSLETLKLNNRKAGLPTDYSEISGRAIPKMKSSSKLYDSHVFDSFQEGEKTNFRPSRRVLSTPRNMDDIITYKDALEYRQEKLTPKITKINIRYDMVMKENFNKYEMNKSRNEKYKLKKGISYT